MPWLYLALAGLPRGRLGTAVLGILLYAESAAPGRLVSIALIVIGILGLRFSSSS